MSNAFAKAAAKAPATKKKSTEWLVDDPVAAAAISELVEADAQAREAESRVKSLKEQLCAFADGGYVHHLATHGAEPERPIVLINPVDHAQVTYVVQDRSASTALDDDQVDELHELVGAGLAGELLTERQEFGFDAEVLEQPTADGQSTVREVLGAELDKIATKLRRKGVLSAEQAEGFLVARRKRVLQQGTLTKMPELLGRSAKALGRFLEIVGKASSRYIKV